VENKNEDNKGKLEVI